MLMPPSPVRIVFSSRDLEDSGVFRLLLGEGAGRSEADAKSTSRDSAVGDSWRRKGRVGSSDRFDPEGGMSSSVPLASAVKGSGFCAGYTVRCSALLKSHAPIFFKNLALKREVVGIFRGLIIAGRTR